MSPTARTPTGRARRSRWFEPLRHGLLGPLSRTVLSLLAGISLAACGEEEPAPPAVLLDGLFDEWSDATSVIDDPPDAPASAVDVLSIQALDEPPWLFMALDVGNEVALQALPGTLHLLLDADGDRGTGGSAHDMEGVDLVVDFSPVAPGQPGRGAGFAVRALGGTGADRPVAGDALGLMAAPTWSAPRFELRLSRRGAETVPPLAERIRMKAVYVVDGEVQDETAVGSYAFRTRRGEPAPVPVADRIERTPGTVRVAQWNVAWHSFSERTADFSSVLATLEPDVVLLDELPDTITPGQLERFFRAEPLGRLGGWETALGSTGGPQRAAVASRLGTLRPAPALQEVTYSPGALEGLGANGGSTTRAFMEREATRGISAAGAWVEVDGRAVLFVSADLQSGGWPGSPQDGLRVLQATRLHERIGEARAGRPAPVVIGGDLNLVGSRAPLFALVRGLDLDGSDLAAVDAERLGERTYATWRNPRDRYAPGRLDFLLVPEAALEVVDAFVFGTEDLDDEALEGLGLDGDVMRGLSDHLVTVADLASASTGGDGPREGGAP